MQVGDYVRTKYGIAKINKIDMGVNACEIDRPLNDFYFVLNENIIKSSPNIIDLIEVGDYVNGWKVYEEHGNLWYRYIDEEKNNCITQLRYTDIETIVTKEMFANAEYRVESN